MMLQHDCFHVTAGQLQAGDLIVEMKHERSNYAFLPDFPRLVVAASCLSEESDSSGTDEAILFLTWLGTVDVSLHSHSYSSAGKMRFTILRIGDAHVS